MKKIILLVVSLLFLAGCHLNPGYISVTQSKFDNATEMSMKPAWCESAKVKFGLFWSSKMKNDDLILVAAVRDIRSFAPGESLWFNIDGKKVGLKPMDVSPEIVHVPGFHIGTTYIEGHTTSSMRYAVSKQFIQRLIDAESVIVKVSLDRTSVEDVFSTDIFNTAKPAFRDFLEKLQNGSSIAGL